MTCASSSKDAAGGGGTRRRRHARAVGFRRWLARAQGLGQELTVGELVSELHVRRGVPLPEVAQVLGVSVEAVREHGPKRRGARAARVPQPEADLPGLREHVGVVLWQTVEETFFGGTADAEKEGARRPPMMAVRMKALKQMAKLYGAGRKRRGGERVGPACATPEEIAEAVRERRGRDKICGTNGCFLA